MAERNWEIEFKLRDIDKLHCKTQEEYKSALKVNGVRFIEISNSNCTIVVPEYQFSRMTQSARNKLLSILKEK